MSSKIQIPLEKVIDIKIDDNNIIFEVEGHKITFKKKNCQWCGKPFTPHSPNNKYCSDNCKKYAQMEVSAKSSDKYRKRYKDMQLSKASIDLGTGGIRAHRVNDFEEEYKLIQKELKRRGLR